MSTWRLHIRTHFPPQSRAPAERLWPASHPVQAAKGIGAAIKVLFNGDLHSTGCLPRTRFLLFPAGSSRSGQDRQMSSVLRGAKLAGPSGGF